MSYDLYAEKLSMLNLTNKTLSICDDHENNQYKKLLESRDSSLLWFLENSKNIDISFPENKKDIVLININGIMYSSSNKNVIDKAKQVLKIKKDKEKPELYIPSKEELENSLSIEKKEVVKAIINPVETNENYNSKYESRKSCFSFVYTEYEVFVYQNGETSNNFKLYLYPLRMYENKLDPSVIAVVETGGFEKKRRIIHELCLKEYGGAKIRTYFKQGKLYGTILPSKNFEYCFEVKEQKIHSALDKKNAYFGHLCFKYINSIVHVFPYSLNNDEKGNAPCLVIINGSDLVKKEDEQEHVYINSNGVQCQIVTYWQDETLISDIVLSSS